MNFVNDANLVKGVLIIILAQKFKGLALLEQKYTHIEARTDSGPPKRK
jgi:hypothetical protein